MMAATNPQLQPHVIVVGARHSDFLKEMGHLAAEYGLAMTQCDDIYLAATELARHPGQFLVAAGMFRQSIRDKGDFFALAERHGVRCCCLLDGESDVERDKILAALRLGVRLAGDMADIRQFLGGRQTGEGHPGREADKQDFSSEPFRATEDELKALLRQETDG